MGGGGKETERRKGNAERELNGRESRERERRKKEGTFPSVLE